VSGVGLVLRGVWWVAGVLVGLPGRPPQTHVRRQAVMVPVKTVAPFLDAHHYLGASRRGFAWSDESGVIVFASPTSRHLPKDWLELSRWCLYPPSPNAGSRQWARAIRALKAARPEVTTIVSYSDPSQGHTGALYKACNWYPAPTWHRLRPPPSGGGSWDGVTIQAPKDRWVYPIRPDVRRASVLAINDAALVRRGFVGYCEPARFNGRKQTCGSIRLPEKSEPRAAQTVPGVLEQKDPAQ
jgi:hypothetical protein